MIVLLIETNSMRYRPPSMVAVLLRGGLPVAGSSQTCPKFGR